MRHLIALLIVTLGLGAACTATAETYPARPVRIIVGLAAGGAPDTVARLLGDKLGAALGQRTYVENRTGSGGNIASDAVAHAPADGYTLYLAAHPPFAINQLLYSQTPYDATKDFEPISLLVSQWFVLTVNPALPIRTIQEFVAYVKARPGQLTYGSSGTGTPHHLGMELLKLALGLDLTHVPYKGSSASMLDLLNGQLPVAFTAYAVAKPYFDSGKLVPIAVTSRTRASDLPDLPTIAETVVPNYEVTAWYGIVAPAHTDKDIVRRLNREIVAIMHQPDIVARMNTLGLDVQTSTPDEMRDRIAAEIATWGRVVREAKLKVE